ncbi:MAG: FAD-binding oxidoreductase [Chloroflexota bacterium]
MNQKSADVVICGAGIAGVATAYYLAQQQGIHNVLIIDKHPPLMQTTAKSGENYRNWWPSNVMAQFMNRSIVLMDALADQSGNVFNMERRGYVYVSCNSGMDIHGYIDHHRQLDIGPIRTHAGVDGRDTLYTPPTNQGYKNEPDGADILVNSELIQQVFPHLTHDAQVVIHARQGGAISAQQLGVYMLDEAKTLGVQEVRGEVVAILHDAQGVSAVDVVVDGMRERIETRAFVNAAGPFASHIAAMLDIDLPMSSVLQQKIAIRDVHSVIPRNAPFTIFMDSQHLEWSDQERAELASDSVLSHLLDEFPGGLHIKPEGGEDSEWIKLGWAINRTPEDPLWEPPIMEEFPDLMLRGASRLVPGLRHYVERLPKPVVHYAGYYPRTEENLPLIGPMDPLGNIKGVFIVGALSGFGTMAGCAAGELAAAWVAGQTEMPSYTKPLSLARYDEPGYLDSILGTQLDGQL